MSSFFPDSCQSEESEQDNDNTRVQTTAIDHDIAQRIVDGDDETESSSESGHARSKDSTSSSSSGDAENENEQEAEDMSICHMYSAK